MVWALLAGRLLCVICCQLLSATSIRPDIGHLVVKYWWSDPPTVCLVKTSCIKPQSVREQLMKQYPSQPSPILLRCGTRHVQFRANVWSSTLPSSHFSVPVKSQSSPSPRLSSCTGRKIKSCVYLTNSTVSRARSPIRAPCSCMQVP